MKALLQLSRNAAEQGKKRRRSLQQRQSDTTRKHIHRFVRVRANLVPLESAAVALWSVYGI